MDEKFKKNCEEAKKTVYSLNQQLNLNLIIP